MFCHHISANSSLGLYVFVPNKQKIAKKTRKQSDFLRHHIYKDWTEEQSQPPNAFPSDGGNEAKNNNNQRDQ